MTSFWVFNDRSLKTIVNPENVGGFLWACPFTGRSAKFGWEFRHKYSCPLKRASTVFVNCSFCSQRNHT